MKRKDFNDFKFSLNLSIEIDSSIRRISEKIKLLQHLRRDDALIVVNHLLSKVDGDIDSHINDIFPDDEHVS